MVKKHPFRDPILVKSLPQPGPHRFVGRPAHIVQTNAIPALIIYDPQRITTASRLQLVFPFEIHLPQLVRSTALKPSQGRSPSVLFADLPTTTQYPIDGSLRYFDPLSLEQYLQLPGSPPVAPPQLDHSVLLLLRCPPRTAMRAPRSITKRQKRSCLPVPIQPLIPRRPTDPILLAQLRHAALFLQGSHYKLDPLFHYILHFPGQSETSFRELSSYPIL